MIGDKDKLSTSQGEDDMPQKLIASQVVVEYVDKIDNLVNSLEAETKQSLIDLFTLEYDKDLISRMFEQSTRIDTMRFFLKQMKEHAEMREQKL
jgi:hypothetical protein